MTEIYISGASSNLTLRVKLLLKAALQTVRYNVRVCKSERKNSKKIFNYLVREIYITLDD